MDIKLSSCLTQNPHKMNTTRDFVIIVSIIAFDVWKTEQL